LSKWRLKWESKEIFFGAYAVTGKLKVTQIKSGVGRIKKQRQIIRALGIKRLHQSVEHPDTPQLRGMIEKVSHLVKVEEV
jgi:large subunit ribosomal protein L30